ncbi:MAG: hypothetical protein JWM99_4351 [Verrucomicrobiales bacterium]|nr:hypothetical protein [Verrucomicrobiales bacterium]
MKNRNDVGYSYHRILKGTLFVLICGLVTASSALNATPSGEPICGTPSSFDFVQAVRAKNALTAKKATTIRAQQTTLPPTLLIESLSPSNSARLTLGGSPGQSYQLEATSDLDSDSWTSWLSVTLGDKSLIWDDTLGSSNSSQFYRLRSSDPQEFQDSASNFRLLDQDGITHDLYYNTQLDGIAVLAAGTNLTSVVSLLPILNDLSKTYSNRVQTWVLLSDPAPVRSNIIAQAKSLNIAFPILFDQQGLAAGCLGLTHAGEVALVQPPDFMIAYRGEVSATNQSTASASFLGQAIAALTTAQPITYLRTASSGLPLVPLSLPTPDYSRDIAPIFYKYCAICHHPDGVAPFAMTNYSIIQEWAPVIKHALLTRKMPPWHADPEYGHFANDLSVPGDLTAALIRWIDAGAPRGNGNDPLAELPRPPAFDQWPPELGEPDALVTIPTQSIKAEGSEPYRYIFVQTPNPSNVWLRAAIVRPSNYRSVHHILVWPGQIGNFGVEDFSTYQSHIAEFVPGIKPFRIPSDSYIPLGKSNWVTFNLHYTPNGVATNDNPVLALWYYKVKPAKTWGVAAVARFDLNILPGVSDSPVQTQYTTSSKITVYRFNPHMHLRGKRMKFEVIYPNGTRETLLSVPDYDFNWQVGYDLAEPKILPAGSRVIATGAFDNSPQNLANPDPTATVHWGDQSWMEMFIGYMDYTQ